MLAWISIGINVILAIWMASLQIRASKAEAVESYDPIAIIKRSSKSLVNSIKPFVFSTAITIISAFLLYLEFSDTAEITKLDIFKISLLSSLLAIGISSFFVAWYWVQSCKLLLGFASGFAEAFKGDSNDKKA